MAADASSTVALVVRHALETELAALQQQQRALKRQQQAVAAALDESLPRITLANEAASILQAHHVPPDVRELMRTFPGLSS